MYTVWEKYGVPCCYSRWDILCLRGFKRLIMKTIGALSAVSNESYVLFITERYKVSHLIICYSFIYYVTNLNFTLRTTHTP